MAVMVALHERHGSGLGQFIDLALYEPMLLMLGHFFVDFDQLGIAAGRLGSRLPFASPRNIFRSADGKWIAMSCAAQSVFERACRAIGHPELIDDSRYLTNQLRTINAETLDATFEQWIGSRKSGEVLKTLNEAGAAAAPVYDIPDVFSDPHFQARQNIATVADEELGQIRMQNVAPRLSRTPGRIRNAGPRLGADTDSVLTSWLGLGQDELQQLHLDKVI
jgi:crotonobetainyl-CoA:carnitine CoA-transferase CaiB-like acyl-CoA transferase